MRLTVEDDGLNNMWRVVGRMKRKVVAMVVEQWFGGGRDALILEYSVYS